jgi:hypothetical protein
MRLGSTARSRNTAIAGTAPPLFSGGTDQQVFDRPAYTKPPSGANLPLSDRAFNHHLQSTRLMEANVFVEASMKSLTAGRPLTACID